MGEKPLDPTNQADWEKFGKKFEADFDALETEQEEIKKAEGDINKDKESLTPQEQEYIDRLESELENICNRPEFEGYKNKKGNPQRLAEYIKQILKQAKEDIRTGNQYDAFEILLSKAKAAKAKSIVDILENIKNNTEREGEEKARAAEAAQKAAEEAAAKKIADEEAARVEAKRRAQEESAKKKKKTSKPKTKLEKGEIDSAIAFFDKDILPIYKAERERNNWTGYSEEVLRFLEIQFKETAKTFDVLDGDERKIEAAWDSIFKGVEGKVASLEEEIKKESQAKLSPEEEYMKLSPDDLWKKLESAGADQDDMNHFFNLDLQSRVNFLMCSEDELKEKIKNLKEQREARKQAKSQEDLELEKKHKEERIKNYGEYLKSKRTEYLQKEYEFNKTAARLKRIFRMDKIDMGNAEEDLQKSKEDYQEAVKHYIDVIVDNEGVNDEEEREIIYRYIKTGEALQVMDVKEDIKFQNHPYFEAMKRDFGVGALSFIDKYKELIGKPKEFLQKKTNSSI